MFNAAHWYAVTIECERPKDVQKVIGQWDIPPTLQVKVLKLCKKKKGKKKTLTYCLSVKSKTKIMGYRKAKGLW